MQDLTELSRAIRGYQDKHNCELYVLAMRAEVPLSTLVKYRKGDFTGPFNNLRKVARYLGYEICVRKTEDAK